MPARRRPTARRLVESQKEGVLSSDEITTWWAEIVSGTSPTRPSRFTAPGKQLSVPCRHAAASIGPEQGTRCLEEQPRGGQRPLLRVPLGAVRAAGSGVRGDPGSTLSCSSGALLKSLSPPDPHDAAALHAPRVAEALEHAAHRLAESQRLAPAAASPRRLHTPRLPRRVWW